MSSASSHNRRVLTKATLTDPNDAIVISGIAGRYPNSDNVADFARNLYSKVDMVDSEEKRWKHLIDECPKRFGKVNNLDKFDANFFSVHRRQAHSMDPQCRMLLEHSYEAILDAGVNPKTLRGSRTGVFVGCCFAESEETLFYSKLVKDGLGLTGGSRAMLANRISFALGLKGTSFMVDTACSSSMYALDCAFNAMMTGECDAALVGGTNLLLHPNVSIQFARLGVLSKDGFCRPFDHMAAGYSRSEGVTVIFLQRRGDAKRMYANFMYSKTNNDGFKKEGITYPAGPMQVRLLQEFYDDLNMDPGEVDFVEAHSTGTLVGDPEECNTLETVFLKNRTKPLPVGSVKSNMGHCEANSGLASVTKVVLTFETNTIPANIHYVKPRAGIPALEEGRIKVIDENTELSGPLICTNSFGFGGGNAHALFRGNTKVKVNGGIPTDEMPRLVIWSGRTEEGVKTVLDDIKTRPLDAEYVALLHGCQSESIFNMLYRGYGLYKQQGEENAVCMESHTQHFDGMKRPVVWVYSGMGSQWCGMGKDLMKIPIFAESIEKSHAILATRGLNLKEIITSDDKTMFDNILHSFVGISAIQIALTDVMKALGVTPDFIIGHSFGELGCSYADGCFTAEETILSSYSRGMASIETKTVFGSMAAVGLGYQTLKSMIPDGIEIACHNSSDSSTISGPAELVATFVAELKSQNVFAKEVPCSNIPYHSSYISEMGQKLFNRLKDVIKTPKARSEKWICSSVPKTAWGTHLAKYSSAEYHTNNLLGSVLFEEATEYLPKDAITIEIAPHGLLQAIIKYSLPEALHIPLTKRGHKENCNFFLESIGKLFVNGIDMSLQNIHPKIEYPVSRGTPMISSLIKWDHSETFFVTNYEDHHRSEIPFFINISDDFDYINGHTIDGRVLFPATGYIYLAWQAFADITRVRIENCDVEIEDVKFLRATSLTKDKEVKFDVVINRGTGTFGISEGNSAVATGIIRSAPNTKLIELKTPEENNEPNMESKDFYKELRLRGYNYSGIFRSVVNARADGAKGEIKWTKSWVAFLDCMMQMQIIGKDSRGLILPTSIRRIVIKPQEHLAAIEKLGDVDIKTLPIIACKNLLAARCGGIEMRDMQASRVVRRRPPGVPVLESYEFVPHLPTPTLSHDNFGRFCVQLLLENLAKLKYTMVEIDTNDDRKPFADFFAQAFGDLPLITGEINYLTQREVEFTESKIKVADCAYSSFNDINFMVQSDLLSNIASLESIKDFLSDFSFILSRESVATDNRKILQSLPEGYRIISISPFEDELVVLINYRRTDFKIPEKVIRVTSENYDWLEPLKDAVKEGPVVVYAQNDPLSGLIGMANCLRKEPEGANLICVFVDDAKAPKFDINDSFYRSIIDQGLGINVFKNGKWGSYRHFKLLNDAPIEAVKRTDHCYVNNLINGDLSSLTWMEGPLNYEKYDPKNIVSVQYSSLNFRDVMLATGKLQDGVVKGGSDRLLEMCVLGFEFSGIMEHDGQRVMGMIPYGAMSTRLSVDRDLNWIVPDDWTLEDAATGAVVYGTVYSAFFISTHIQAGKSVLIHAGTGGVGLAAIHTAFNYGLEVFTTVSTEEKKKYLLSEFPQLKAENIGNSRDCSFEDMIMTRTNGKGVDYVLNSLADDKLQASIRCLGSGGVFLEIGKFDMKNDSKIGLGNFLKELTFTSVLVDNLFYGTKEEKLRLRNLVQKDLDAGLLKPLKRTVFDLNQVEQGFRLLASGKHMGKVVLKIRENETDKESLPIKVVPRVYYRPDCSYIIAGGLGGFGLELADWLVLRGCRKLVLSSSRGITKAYQSYRIKIWEAYGVQVQVNTADITTRAGCEKLIRDAMRLGPVGGIFNLAVQLRDNIFENQDVEKFIECMAPKADATKHFDELSRQICPELQHFVVFSSVSCGRGNAGQTNYGMANSVMERIVEHRHQLGLPAKAIQWGAVGEVGLVADMAEDAIDMVIGGTLQQRISSCLEEMDSLLTSKSPLVASMVVAEKKYSAGGKGNIIETLMNIMSIRDAKAISMDMSLAELGMDSLMTVEIQQTLERDYDLVITTQELRSMTIGALVKAAKKQDFNPSDFKDSKVPIGIGMLIRNLGDEKFSNQTVLKLNSKSYDFGVRTLIIPGIEGMAGKAWYDLAENLTSDVNILQLKKTSYSKTIDEVFNLVSRDVEEVFGMDQKFVIVGYSFGALLALKLAEHLETLGKFGKVVLIDGSPKFLRTLATDQLINLDEEALQTAVLLNVMATMFPEDNGDKLRNLLSFQTWIERVNKLIELLAEKVTLSDEYIFSMLNALVNRIQLVREMNDEKFAKLQKTTISLIRPSEFSLTNMPEDYGLSACCDSRVTVEYVEGNHTTILENPKLVTLLNKTY